MQNINLSSRAQLVNQWYRFSILISLAFLFLCAMNVYSVNLGGSGLEIPYNLFSWLSVSVIVIFGVLRVLVYRELRIHPSTLHYLVFLAFLLGPLIYTDTLFLDVELSRLAGIAAGAVFLIAIQQENCGSMRRGFIFIIFISSLIQTVLGLVQYYIEIEGSEYIYLSHLFTPFGIFQQVNVFSIYLGVGSLIGVYLWATSSFCERFLPRVGLFLLILANGRLIELSGGQAAQLVNVLCFSAYITLLASAHPGRRLFLSALWVTFVISLIPVSMADKLVLPVSSQEKAKDISNSANYVGIAGQDILSYAQDGAQEEVTLLTSLRQMAGTRPTIYWVSLQMFLDSPLKGHGIGAFRKQYLLYQGAFLRSNPTWKGEFSLSHPHNELLYWGAELGLVSLLAFVYLLLYWIFALRRKYLDPYIFFLASPFVLHSLLELPFYHSAPHWLAFLVILAASVRKDSLTFSPVSAWSAVVIVPVLAWGILKVWVYMLSTLFALKMFLLFDSSDRTAISHLREINNPSAFKLRYEFELFQWNFREARKAGMIDLDQLNAFFAWSFSTLQYAPMVTTYENFISGLVLTGNLKAARKYLDEAMLMYPYEASFQDFERQLEQQSTTYEG